MQTLELGYVNAGFVIFAVAILATLIFGRFFCGWACHVVAYQDASAWLLAKLGMRPRPIRSRLLVWVPLCAALYMFVWPSLARWIEGVEFAGFRAHFQTDDFWASFPGPGIALLTFAVDGCLIVYFLGAKGFCTYGCPYGAVFAIAERASPARIRVTDACEGCGHCTATCTSNVLVHAEVARFGQVVDPGCMKCLDCVSVCPKDALYFGLGESRSAALKRTNVRSKPVGRVYDFSVGEELALALIFMGSLLALRGLYDLVPFLLAIGLAVLSALAGVLCWRTIVRARVVFQGRALRLDGRRTALGWTALSLCLPWFVFLGHSSLVQVHATRGRWLLLDAKALAPDQRAPLLARSLEQLDRAAELGLVPVAELEFQRGQIQARQADWDSAKEHLRRAIELDGELALARVELADVALKSPEHDVRLAREQLERVLARHPEHPQARELLGLLEFQTAQAARLSGDPSGSEQHLLRALELQPTLVPAGLDLSDLLMSKLPPDVEGARKSLRALIGAVPGQAEALRRLKVLDERFAPSAVR